MKDVVANPRDTPAERVRDVVQYLYPDVLILVFILVGASYSIYKARKEAVAAPKAKGPGGKPLPVTKRSKRVEPQQCVFGPSARLFFQSSSIFTTLTFVATGIAITARALVHRADNGEQGWWCGEPETVYILGSALVWVYFTLTLFEWPTSPSLVHMVTWSLALLGEITITTCDAIVLSGSHKVMTNLGRNKFKVVDELTCWDVIELSFSGIRLGLIFGMVLVYTATVLARRFAQRVKVEEYCQSEVNESTPLMHPTGNNNAAHYHTNGHINGRSVQPAVNGNTNGAADASHQMVDEEASFYRPEKLPHTTWLEYLRGYSVFFPYMWPSKKRRLQAIVVVCFVLLCIQRYVNIMVPRQIGVVTNELAADNFIDGSERRPMPWASLGLLVMYKLLQGPSGILGSLRSILWIPVSQHTYRALMTSAFEHVHSLSLDFHLGKRTGEVLSALNKGSAVNSFLEQVTFQVFPIIIDLFIAVNYFYIEFDAVYAVIVSGITFYYLYLTIRMASKTADQRRLMSNLDREEEAVKNDSIISYETVKYFNAEGWEAQRYSTAVQNFQAAEAKVTMSINVMNVCQSMTFMVGMLVAMMFGAYQVTQGYRKVGDFVMLITYLGQLQGPLNFFGTFYRTVQQAMISGERLLELFKQQPTVIDRPGAATVTSCEGRVEFSKVGFAYDPRKPALKDLTFTCEPGTTTALVGESGGGKSTLFRLMYRYYNCQEGHIRIDGQDVKDVTIDSVRRFIGVVPQDTILFNDTLMYNLRYANQAASDEDIFAACKAASIHDRIMAFPDGYNTKVGERGMRLSGGEKQRVAIARTLLKNPKIIMLDEATSALDSRTEQDIQSRLTRIGEGHTLMVIAHRLSTITHAHQILVLKNGSIVERGQHKELLALGGVYADMYNRQAKAQKAADDFKVAKRKAEKLMRKANIPHTEHHGSDKSTAANEDSSSSSDESSCHTSSQSDELQPASTSPRVAGQ
ncbi:hypothetical protein DL766_007353 [Monosporascus sp. MC13-8B]|uniref:ABC transporter domain-containing protein n=1 Tax=Monosporascus cannonballus TaxID=155416 RepID=A0ABY0H559_9PEZI|nr:hypothetical protein DL762_005316 [Monosporascus cannonballus]RYO88437.1 hypothetical protein DL763_006017 [Monosporascus cannonballus]RYP24144.1 hypothetical protein DL766_007353 [Monosporascus sp. MC13-8B]